MFNMPGASKEGTCKRLTREDDERTLQSMKRELKPHKRGNFTSSKRKVINCLHKGNGNVSLKKKRTANKAIVHKTKTSKKKQSLSSHKPAANSTKGKIDYGDVKPQILKRRKKRKKGKTNVDVDEASRLKRRTSYLLLKMKQEQNFIDAYSAEGWKGHSREKIKPEKELQRAKKQILKYKLGIREAIHQLDLLSSEGHINDAAIAPDGSVHHEYIICAKCKLREALPDNDIILCDGTCNCAFHQKCLDPPLSTEHIPKGDEGWFCKFCKNKMEILETTNAHLGTQFPLNVNWQDVFKEEAALPDDGDLMLCPEEVWPSDDSDDDDYDPDRIDHDGSDSVSRSGYDASDCSSSYPESLEDETDLASGSIGERSNRSLDNSNELMRDDSDDVNNVEVVCHPRQRAAVDYIKLHDEMFGKNAYEDEQVSEDEDWGPTERKRKVKETRASSTPITLGETDKRNSEDMLSESNRSQLIQKMKRPIFRLPHDAVEKLRLVFSENELPERALRVSLSKQLGLEFEKVNKWFKNARYLALKARKQAERAQASQDCIPKESISESAEGGRDQMASTSLHNRSILKTFVRRSIHPLANSLKKKQRQRAILRKAKRNQTVMDHGDDVSLKHLRKKAKEAKKKLNCKNTDGMLEAEGEMERLCQIKSRVENLQQVLTGLPICRFGKAGATHKSDPSVIFVPVAEVKEKR